MVVANILSTDVSDVLEQIGGIRGRATRHQKVITKHCRYPSNRAISVEFCSLPVPRNKRAPATAEASLLPHLDSNQEPSD